MQDRVQTNAIKVVDGGMVDWGRVVGGSSYFEGRE